MRSKEENSKGFTLVEVLIVAVIIAILAALILPRMTSQVGKAQAAEAFQVLGAIKRAAERQFSLTQSYTVPDCEIATDSTGVWGNYNVGSWSTLGLKGLEGSGKWSYYYYGCDPWGYAVEVDNVQGDGMYYDGWNRVYTCYGDFSNINDDPAQPCIIK